MQKSISCVQQVITMNWLKPQDLRSVAVSLYNIGVDLYNSKNLEQVSSLFINLSCIALLFLCESTCEAMQTFVYYHLV